MNDLNFEIKTGIEEENKINLFKSESCQISLNRGESSNDNEDPFLNINESSLTIWEVFLFNPEYSAQGQVSEDQLCKR
jgi:hypothetical protein